MAWFAYPEDRGTTGSSTEEDWDWNASANLATLAEESHLTDHILDGFTLSWDGSSVTVSSGIAKVTYSGGTSSYADQEDRPWPVTFVAGNTADQSFNQAADTVWDVYLTFDLAGGDSVSYVFDDTDTTPSADVVLFLGTIDTTDGTVVDNGPRRPDIEADFTTVYEAIEYENGGSTGTLQWSPTTDRTIELPDSDGTVALLSDTGGGSTSVSDDGTEVLAEASDLNFTANLNVTDDGDGSVSIDTSALDQEEVEDAINTVISGGTNVTTSYDDTNGVLTINSTDSTLTNEEVQDITANLLTGGSNTTVTYDDANNTVTIDTTNPSVSDDGTEVLSEPSDLNFGPKLAVSDDGDSTVSVSTSALDQEEVEDAVDTLLTAGSNISLTYDDTAGTLTIDGTDSRVNASDNGSTVLSNVTDINFGDKLSVTDDGDGSVSVSTSALDSEEVQDEVNSLVAGGTNVTVTYDDAGNTLTFDSPTLTNEEVEDMVGALVSAGSNVSVNYDDANNSLTVSATDTHTDVSDGGTTVVSNTGDVNFGDKLSVADDGDQTVTVSTSALDTEEVEDAVGNLVAGGSNVTVSYDDANNSLTVTATDSHVDVSDGGTLVVGDVSDINFGANLTVTDDGDGSVTIEASGGGVDAEDSGSVVVSGATAINFGSNVSVTDDGDGTVTVNASGGGGGSEPSDHPHQSFIVNRRDLSQDRNTVPNKVRAANGHLWVDMESLIFLYRFAPGETVQYRRSNTFVFGTQGTLGGMDLSLDGRYCYCSQGGQVAVLDAQFPDGDVTNENHSIKQYSTLDTGGADAAGLTLIDENHVAIQDDTRGSGIIRIIDVSDPTSLTEVGTISDVNSQTSGTINRMEYKMESDMDGHLFFGFADGNFDGNFAVADVSDPTSPSVITDIFHADAFGGISDYWNGYAYMRSGSTNQFHIYDVSDPANPTVAASPTYGPGGARWNYTAPVVKDGFAYGNDGSYLWTIDVRDPSTASAINRYPTNTGNTNAQTTYMGGVTSMFTDPDDSVDKFGLFK